MEREKDIRMNKEKAVLSLALSEIERMVTELKLSVNIREAAYRLCQGAAEKNLIYRRSIESISSAALYITCREHKVPYTLREIAKISRSPLREIRRSYYLLRRELGIEITSVDPRDYVLRFCSMLDLSEETVAKAMNLITQATEAGLSNGRTPIGIAGAAIYIAAILCGERRTQQEIREVTGVTELTIRERYKEMVEKLDMDALVDNRKIGRA